MPVLGFVDSLQSEICDIDLGFGEIICWEFQFTHSFLGKAGSMKDSAPG